MRLTAPVKAFSDGFSTADDIFGRKNLHDIIMRVATNAPDKSLVLALNDEWGNGKTSFVKMMASEINKNHADQFDVIYFDAFENDYQSDPFVSLTSKIYSLIKKEEGTLNSLGKELLSIGKKLGASFALNGAKFAVSTLTSGLVSGSTLEKASDAISDSLTSPIEEYIEEKIKTSENELATIEQFRTLLTKIHTESQKKIIFIIDELDRSRPDFSLDLLEKIKHIFSVEGFIFLLVINREQFEKSIECRYGSINTRLYLNKFIHYWFTLPKKSMLAPACRFGYERSTLTQYLLTLDEGNNLLSRNGSLVKTLSYLLETNNCSLREAERCYSVFAVMASPNEVNTYRHEVFHVGFALVAFLKIFSPSLLMEIKNKQITADEVFTRLSLTEKLSDVTEIYYIASLLSYHFATDEELKSPEMVREYAYIALNPGQRYRWFEMMHDKVEGFTIS